MFSRSAEAFLAEWKVRTSRRPLIVRGARQVGKSALVRLFGQRHFSSIAEVNFEQDPSYVPFFSSKDPKAILSLLEIKLGKRIVPGQCLLFLDEIQAAPEAIAALRYFFEQIPELHVIAAGSLLDVALAEPSSSVPVGRIEYMHLGPVSFEEFLDACGQEPLLTFLRGWMPEMEFPVPVHEMGIQWLRNYMFVGGMPASVAAFAATGSFRESDLLKHSVLATYYNDFAKYGGKVDVLRLRRILDAVPRLLGTTVKYSRLDQESRSTSVAEAVQQLAAARVVHRVRHCSGDGVPLAAQASRTMFKLLFLDVGLVASMSGITPLDLQTGADPLFVNNGALAEQFVGQQVLHSEQPYIEPALFYWSRQAANSSAEVDFLLAQSGRVVPVEVKAGKTGTLRSLQQFMLEKGTDLAIRLNSEPPSLTQVTLPLAQRQRLGDPASHGTPSYRLLSVPLYLAGQLRRLARG